MKMKFCYVVQEITCTETEILGGSVKGVYSTLPMAQKAVKEFRKNHKEKHPNGMALYEILMKKIDELPITSKDLENTIERLIKQGLMQALIGEDGYFYYELTDLGEQEAKKLGGESWPNNLKDFYDENGGDTGID